MKKLFTFFSLVALTLALSGGFSPALADCLPIYGGGQSCPSTFNFNIEKTVNDSRPIPEESIKFHITVTNTGDKTIPTITVTDRLPDFLTFVSGPGSFDANTRVITYTVNTLEAGKSSKATEIVAKVAASDKLPSDRGLMCLINRATGTDSNGLTDSSDAQFCIQKKVLGVTAPPVLPAPKIVATPATGAEMIPLLGLIPGALGGLMLRKKSNNIKIEGGEK